MIICLTAGFTFGILFGALIGSICASSKISDMMIQNTFFMEKENTAILHLNAAELEPPAEKELIICESLMENLYQ